MMKKNKTPTIVYLLIPIILYLCIFSFFPIIFSFFLSFQKWKILESEYMGIRNYKNFFQDSIALTSLKNTFYFTIIGVPLNAMVGLCIALLINKVRKFKSLFRTVYFLPVVTSIVALAIVWKWIYQPGFGLLNNILRLSGLTPQMWLKSPIFALPCLIVVRAWRWSGYNMILFLAGLTDIPQVFYEAAEIDGATGWNRFFHITLPLLSRTFLFVLVLSAIWAFQVFAIPYIMTEGGPGNSTRVMVQYIYSTAFQDLNMGYGCALSFVLFAIIITVSLIQFKLLKTKWEY